MGQGGQVQSQSFSQRIKAAAERLVDGAEKVAAPVEKVAETVLGEPTNPAPVATVPDVSGKDVATAPATAPAAPSDTAPAISDVGLLRDQLEQVVSNFRGRIDSVVSDVAGLVTRTSQDAERIASHESRLKAVEDGLEAMVTALETLKSL